MRNKKSLKHVFFFYLFLLLLCVQSVSGLSLSSLRTTILLCLLQGLPNILLLSVCEIFLFLNQQTIRLDGWAFCFFFKL